MFDPGEGMGFASYAERVYRESLELGIPSIDPLDAFALYAAALASASQARGGVVAVDAGAGIGYSTLWLAKALDDACPAAGGCTVYAVERLPALAARAREVLRGYPWRRVAVEVVEGDALQALRGIGDPRIVFVDVDKHLYPEVLRLMWPRIPPGGLLAFHNAYAPRPPREFFEQVNGLEDAAAGVAPSPAGLLLLLKRPPA